MESVEIYPSRVGLRLIYDAGSGLYRFVLMITLLYFYTYTFWNPWISLRVTALYLMRIRSIYFRCYYRFILPLLPWFTLLLFYPPCGDVIPDQRLAGHLSLILFCLLFLNLAYGFVCVAYKRIMSDFRRNPTLSKIVDF